MSEMELVELFRVKAPTFRAAIKAIYKSGMLFPMTTQRCDLACLKVGQHFTTLKWSLHLQYVRWVFVIHRSFFQKLLKFYKTLFPNNINSIESTHISKPLQIVLFSPPASLPFFRPIPKAI